MIFFRKKTKTKETAKKNPDRNLKLVWILIILALPMGIFLKEFLQLRELKTRIRTEQKTMEQVKKEIAVLEKERDTLRKEDPQTVEKLAREQLKYTRPGEVVYVPAQE